MVIRVRREKEIMKTSKQKNILFYNGKYFQVEKNIGAGGAGDFDREGGKGRGDV